MRHRRPMERPDRPPVQGEVVDRRSHREVPIARKRSRTDRAIFFFGENETGRTILGWTLGLILAAPFFLFKWWWAAILTAAVLGFAAGYWVARRSWLDDGDVPPL